MAWQQMRFKNQLVFVAVDEKGKPLLDSDGRAEMKYRASDPRSYRPVPQNLFPAGPGTPKAPISRRPRNPGQRGQPKSAPAKRPKANKSAPMPDHAIAVWTDGACSGNPGPAGLGVVVIGPNKSPSDTIEHNRYLGLETNNVAELAAILDGLEIVSDRFGTKDTVAVYSDSSYSIGLLSQGVETEKECRIGGDHP